ADDDALDRRIARYGDGAVADDDDLEAVTFGNTIHFLLHGAGVGIDVDSDGFRGRRCGVHTRSTKLSTTRFSPARSNRIVSLLPSMAVMLPLPNFWWKTRSPSAKAERVPVDLAISSPSMVRGRRLRPVSRERGAKASSSWSAS